MTLLYYDPIFQEHRTGNHPESAERLAWVVRHLQWTGLDSCCRRPAWERISFTRLFRNHERDYVDQLAEFSGRGGGLFALDTVASGRTYDVARMAAGAACDATERVVRGEDKNAFCLLRPPGHHALRAGAMGFCFFNHVALAAQVAIDELGLDRVLIVDWDVHHGNGTQDTFWRDGRVGFASIHRWPFYPGTGAADETGTGDGLGTTLNLPIEFGTPVEDYLQIFASELERFAARIKPQMVFISAGFDAHRDDPVGSLGLDVEAFRTQTKILMEIAAAYADHRLVSVLEGGYNPGALTDCVDAHLDQLLRGLP